ncbi:MAG: cation transporter [Lachnospiraceae bacterium]|nr:cation transporter [Lachnospiraceae bacterium]
MITLLARIFIKDRNDTTSPEVRQAYGVLCGAVGIVLNILLFIGKFFAGAISHSISITADAFNNLSDAGSSVISLIGFKMSGQKPDIDHPFGHGRIEYLSGLFVSIAILFMGFELVKSSVNKIIHPEPIEFSLLIVVILLVSIAVKFYMGFYNSRYGKKLDSATLKATATDSLSDTLATTVVLIATLFAHLTNINIDGYCGVAVGLFILYAGYNAAKETISPLLGQKADPEFVQSIEDLVLQHAEVLGIHDLIVHDYGPGRRMVSLHAEVPASGNILDLHDAIDNIEHELRSKLKCDAVIHMDPIMNDDPETIALKDKVSGLLHHIDAAITMHDFRIVKGPTHTNLIFDVVVPYDFHLNDNEIKLTIAKAVADIDTKYFTVIEVDKAYY